MNEKVYTKELPTDLEILPEAEKFILNIAKEVNLTKEKYNNLALSFSEALSNSITHGNKLDKSKKILITIKVQNDILTVIIKDEGKGFDPAKIPDPTKPENILKDNGRGIHIMKSFLDDLKFNFTKTGTETILILKLR
ncbi:ATP-binding protein [Melioribacteraceae bacterium 4301-Me]|uniref:ATP-binding protein n=1 Tax=Pyranulibacter aquaticus TaxID=3163344 RepID=UPI0035950353